MEENIKVRARFHESGRVVEFTRPADTVITTQTFVDEVMAQFPPGPVRDTIIAALNKKPERKTRPNER
jgi:hypothetical protein